ncbi:MAG: PQQ-binding-like beta-propeller repeat protein [Sedimentisphaerales bacterium]|nr:PQQ-binding-like beta-propeller repeat protein [Sedimentisphaerales bacterium]
MELTKAYKHDVRTFLLALVIVTVSVSFCSTVEAADWPNYRGPNYDGISSESGLSTNWPAGGPKKLWGLSIGAGFATMSVSNGRVYAMGNIDDHDILYCLDADTGKEIWKTSYPCPLLNKNHEGGPCATPTVEGDAVYTLSKNGDAIRFNAATGDIVWHKHLNRDMGFKHPTWYFSSSALLVDNLVILNVGTYGVALNKSDGSLVWQNGKGACGYATGLPCTLNSQKCVVMPVSQEVVGLNPTTGKVLWKFPWKTAYVINSADTIVSDDMVFISTGYNKGCALYKIDGNKPTQIWQNKNMRNHINCSVLWQGHIYGFDGQVGGGGSLACIDFKTGEKKWSQKGMGTGSLMLADNKLIVLGERGKLVIAEASPQGFKELASAQILPKTKCWTMPILANGKIYARSAAGDLVCVDVSG